MQNHHQHQHHQQYHHQHQQYQQNMNLQISNQPQPLTKDESISHLLAILELSIHFLLYIRGVYPPNLFERKKKYNVPVYISRHPELNNYISNIVHQGMKQHVMQGSLKKVFLVILDSRGKVMERFTFELSPFNFASTTTTSSASSLTLPKLEILLRQFLVKISVIESMFVHPVPKEASFCVLIELNPGKGNSNNSSTMTVGQDWVCDERNPSLVGYLSQKRNNESDSAQDRDNGDNDKEGEAENVIIPIKTMDIGIARLQLFAEESKEKAFHFGG